MAYPPAPPSAPPPPAWPPQPAQPPPRRSSPLVPLLVVGAIAVVMLIAGAAAAIMIVMMNSGAFSPVPPIRDTPPVSQAPPPDAPPEAPLEAETAPPKREPSGGAASRPGAAPGSRVGGLAEAPPPPPPSMPIRAGGRIPAPRKIHDVRPVYPRIAQSARVQGVVIIEATIDRRGMVTETRVLRSVPLLDQAALDAVRLWKYEPTLLNGAAVPVIVTVTVNFTLQ
jgi:TonB family protein